MKAVAIRRLHFETAHHNKELQHQRIRQLFVVDFEITATPPVAVIRYNDQQPHSTNTTISNTVKDIYVPYQYPFFATCFYYIDMFYTQ